MKKPEGIYKEIYEQCIAKPEIVPNSNRPRTFHDWFHEVVGEEFVVYQLYGEEDEPLYVGVTTDLRHRLRNHYSAWGEEIRSVCYERVRSMEDARQMEQDLWENLAPKYQPTKTQPYYYRGNIRYKRP